MAEKERDMLVERVALAMAKEIGWGTFSHFNPEDMRRLACAAIIEIRGTDILRASSPQEGNEG